MNKSIPRQERGFSREESAIIDEIENFAAQGFRTLMFAKKELASADGISDGF